MEWVLSHEVYRDQRREILRHAEGRTLEIGFGFGATIPEYPADRIAMLAALEPNPGMIRRAAPKIAAAAFPVRAVRGIAERLPFTNGAFDTVVTNWTLCSLTSTARALAEIRRVLAPGGRFLFLEHGLTDEKGLAWRQRFLTPVQKILASGCRLDLDIGAVVRSGGFRIETIDRYESGLPLRVLRQMYRGIARPA